MKRKKQSEEPKITKEKYQKVSEEKVGRKKNETKKKKKMMEGEIELPGGSVSWMIEKWGQWKREKKDIRK